MTIKNKKDLSKKMMENVDSYSDSIKSITDPMEQVRTRPGMYIGPLGAMGLLNMGREVWQNAIDQLVSEISPCDMIWISYNENDNSFIIADNGLGIPFDDMYRVFTQLHTSKNYVKQPGDYSSGLNGIGAKATNALSRYFKVVSYKYTGEARCMVFEKGKLISEKPFPNKDKVQGTVIEFAPDYDIMGATDLSGDEIYALLKDMLSLTSIGNKIDYTCTFRNGKIFHEVIVNENGILTNLMAKVNTPVIAPIIIQYENSERTMKIDAAFTFNPNIVGEDITSFANMCPTSNDTRNTHVKGVVDGICSWFIKYMNNIYLTDKDRTKFKILQNDVRAGLAAMISAFHLEPQFTGQAKEVFSNGDYLEFAKSTIYMALDQWQKDRPNDLAKAAKFLREVAIARVNADKENVKITAKYEKASTGLPVKYNRPTGHPSEGWELIIVEGDSAGGNASSARDPRTQGIFPIRGKILNVYDHPESKIFANQEIVAIKDILGAGYGRSFDLKKVKYKRVIFMTDADADGDHIACLLLLLFIKYFPGLVESGMVYKSVPPLYGKEIKKGKFEYFTERIDYAKYLQKNFIKNHTVTYANGKPLTATNITSLLLDYEDYTDSIKYIVDTYHLDPIFLENLLIARIKNYTFSKIQKMLIDQNRFFKKDNIWKDKNGCVVIRGLVNGSINTIFMNDRFTSGCKQAMDYLDRANTCGELSFILDGNVVGLYSLLRAIEPIDGGDSISRFKGLGEMNSVQLSDAVLSPINRTLIRYTVEDIHHDLQVIRKYESDKRLILNHIESVKKIDLIG